ncbi:MAG: AAA family ATPase [Clostridiales bacterium]|nr:AAA family ATPase [Clostridiales bacterium]
MFHDDIFNEMRVRNKLNETNLEFIGIYGLFGRYSIEIPFERQVNIYIGENGLGKTTILNCIYFILEGKFSRLANIQFSEIKVKFKGDEKTYKISVADLREFNRRNRGQAYNRFLRESEIYETEILEEILIRYKDYMIEANVDSNLDVLIYEYARKMRVPESFAKRRILEYLESMEIMSNSKGKANKDNVVKLSKAIKDNITNRIIYLPTYRRIEDDFASLNIRSEELNKAELLIRFGMSDVQMSIDRILDKIRSLAMEGFTEMTGVLLKQYADGKDPIDDMNRFERMSSVNIDTVKIVLDRVGKEIEEPYKQKILNLMSSGEIKEYKYLYLWNLINKLVDNYDLQKAYDDRIKKFANTCNKYLNDKHFDYNQSTLNLKIYLDNGDENEKKTIQLTQLSSGEKQIVSLFSKLYLESDEPSIVIIDEPELSLSIEWQKMLLPDIMRTNNCKLLITVTHSPFTFANEFDFDAKEIRNYIKMYR